MRGSLCSLHVHIGFVERAGSEASRLCLPPGCAGEGKIELELERLESNQVRAGVSPMQNGQSGSIGDRVRAKELEQEPWQSCVSLGCDCSLHLAWV